MPPNVEGVPGWADEDLRRTAHENVGLGADADLPDEVRFRSSIIRLIRKRLARPEREKVPSIFFLLPEGPQSADHPTDVTVPMLDNGLTSVESSLWFVGSVAAKGLGITIADWADDSVFKFVIDVLGAGDAPAILFETRTEHPEVRFYPKGLADANNFELLRLDASDMSLSEIFTVIDRVYESSFVTPSVQLKVGKLWVNNDKYWVSDKAEDLIQLQLRTGLAVALPSCVVRAEQSQATGRLDLEVEEPKPSDPSHIVRHAILELKVLRSFNSSGSSVSQSETDKWVEDGVRQAASYRKERGSRTSALCCFDMRKAFSGDACFAKVKGLAKHHKVSLRVWYIFASPKAYRDHVTH